MRLGCFQEKLHHQDRQEVTRALLREAERAKLAVLRGLPPPAEWGGLWPGNQSALSLLSFDKTASSRTAAVARRNFLRSSRRSLAEASFSFLSQNSTALQSGAAAADLFARRLLQSRLASGFSTHSTCASSGAAPLKPSGSRESLGRGVSFISGRLSPLNASNSTSPAAIPPPSRSFPNSFSD